MKCPSCGAQAAEGSPFCSSCGASFEGRFPPGTIKGPPRTSGMAIAGFVTSFVCGVLGLIFSLLAWSEVRKSKGAIKGEGFAIAGFVISFLNLGVLILGAIAFSSFFDYMEKSRSRFSEAEYHLKRLERSVRAYHAEHGALPVGSAPLTPVRTCCEDPSGCFSAGAEFADAAAWRTLDFEVYGSQDYQYGYESDGKTFHARATGDRDCDGVVVTYELRVEIVDGTAVGTLTRPTTRD